MLKKLALATALAATASFATYSFFPVGNVHSGQVEVGAQYGWTKHSSNMEMMLGGEFVVIEGLELSLFNIGYQFWNENDDCGEKGHEDCPDNDGLKAMTFGARYQFMPMLAAAVDVNLPFNSDDVVGEYDPFGLYAAIQFSMEFMPGLAFGSELGLSYKFGDDYIEKPELEKSEGLGIKIQAEVDYTIASVGLTPWLGLSYERRLSDIEQETFDNGSKKITEEYGSGDDAFQLWLGVGYAINPMFTVKAQFTMKFADDDTMGTDWKGIKAAFDVNF